MVQQQFNTKTFRGRHIWLIDDVRQIFGQDDGGAEPRKILSFGCSTGEECLDLAESMPQSQIFGCDINERALATATEACKGRVTIFRSGSPELDQAGPFDAVFALNVLCRFPQSIGMDDVSALYPFSLFEAGLTQIDSYLRVGGVLVVFNAQYFFEDSSLSSKYEPSVVQSRFANGFMEKSFPDGRRATNHTVEFEGRVYTRDQLSEWRADKEAQRRLHANPELGGAKFRWIDPDRAQGRSTTRSTWVKIR